MSRILFVLAFICLSPSTHSAAITYDFEFADPSSDASLTGSFTATDDNDNGIIALVEVDSFESIASGFDCCTSTLNDQTADLKEFLWDPASGTGFQYTISTFSSLPSLSHQASTDSVGAIVLKVSFFDFADVPIGGEDTVENAEATVTPRTEPAPVPAPATLALFGLGLAGLGISRWKRTTSR